MDSAHLSGRWDGGSIPPGDKTLLSAISSAIKSYEKESKTG